jgi:hypothetical protein
VAADVFATVEAIVRLSWQLATAVMAHYSTAGSLAERLLVYRQLVRHIESLRAPVGAPGSSCSRHVGAVPQQPRSSDGSQQWHALRLLQRQPSQANAPLLYPPRSLH